ncbi:MFS transporter [Candidatus Bathyarchaeota archaeon]|nr:MFS transporter [Candidatus Bathyarchaeota archaeon]
MLENFVKFFKELDRRVKVTIAGIGVHNWSQRLSRQYNQLYAYGLGANPVELGILSSIGAAASSIVSVPMGWATERYSIKRVLLFALSCTAMVAIIYALAGNWWMLIPAIILGRIANIMPLTDIILINYSKTKQSSTVMGFSRTIWAIPRIFAPLIAAVIVTSFGGINTQGIRPLYYLQFGMVIFVLLFISVMLKTQIEPRKNKGKSDSKRTGFIQDFRELFTGEKWLKRWMILRTIRQFGQRLAMPFISLWMVEMKNATPYILGIMGTVSTIFSVFLPVFAGRLADKMGRKKAFYILRPFMYLRTIVLILAPKPEYLILAGICEGIGQASNIPFLTMHWEMVPKEKRGRWLGIRGLIELSTIPATIIGGIMWQQGFMMEVLLLPIILEALIVMPMLFTIPDTLKKENQQTS